MTTPRLQWPDIASLRLLLLVEEHGSIGRAAHALGLTQASASRRLDTLERELGLPLLLRDTSGSRLTPQGHSVAGWAAGVVDTAEELMVGVAALRERRTAWLRVAASMTIAEYLVPQWLVAFRASASDTEVELRVVNSETVADLLRRSAVDLGFVESKDVPRDLASTRVGTDRLAVVTTPRHPWSRRHRPVPATELAQTPLVMREPGSGTRTTLEQALALATGHGPATPALELSSNAAVKVAVAGDSAPAVLSVLAVANELNDGRFREIAVDGVDMRRLLTAVWQRGTRLSDPATRLVHIAGASEGC
ncbi:LysR family transcriptional regulator [Spiractinospora alimapuensis]|uniref:LysR family transcriptional regulator n=1 Tax=Spiractinospora alimapuensis TaxID=2820884 RepID=UPI001F30E81B|nr:LysR family transcriptional regulator [Spiractinospora alimapuensis]QVQ53289.1 LysR family transcriptional regulator [Spiractinospora alimapuensis]